MNTDISSQKQPGLRIGVIGTAKNTGKTTTLVALMQEARKHDFSLAVTGIGYDGEAIDNLTFLPKPRVEVSPGVVIGTAKECIRQATATYVFMEDTREETSLGRVELIRIESSGRILLAGPNNTHALERVLVRLEKFASLILIDGALGRMVPMSAADAVIFATGAARTTDIPLLASEMKAIQDIFSLEEFPEIHSLPPMPDKVTVYDKNDREIVFGFASLLGNEDISALQAMLEPGITRIAIPGAVSASCVNMLIENYARILEGALFYFDSPSVVLAGGKPLEVRDMLARIGNCGALAAYRRSTPIIAVTINPFYPKPIKRRGLFEAAYVDEENLYHEFSRSLSVPVFNIMKQGAVSLFDLVRYQYDSEVRKK